jgi:predicted nucleotidyltransferase
MESDFNWDEARKNLKNREVKKSLAREDARKKLLEQTKEILFKEFQGQDIELWLIGSITQPNRFSEKSDIDIVIKNYFDDRFALWSSLEKQIGHEIEIIRFEECSFKEDVRNFGLKVL